MVAAGAQGLECLLSGAGDPLSDRVARARQPAHPVARLDTLASAQVPITARTENLDRGRREIRTIQVLDAPPT